MGKWEGDTLVVDTVGFNERFWLTREGVPHTSQLKLIGEAVSPELSISFATKPRSMIRAPTRAAWSGGWNLRWSAGNEPFDYLCQENNRDPQRMVGHGSSSRALELELNVSECAQRDASQSASLFGSAASARPAAWSRAADAMSECGDARRPAGQLIAAKTRM